ncbi:MAG: ABC transporter ATP-binding protein [Deltaproteobacteria bacterium]|nr:ABC transporter ATP-binding protein [Deltaproteobacteria bacterium]
MPETVLEFRGVYKKFKRGEKYNTLRDFVPSIFRRIARGNGDSRLEEKEFWAVNDVSFAVEQGEAFGIIGPNGAGKSTILKLLIGIMHPTRGEKLVKGRLSALIEIGAGFHKDLTGRENIFLIGTILGMTKTEIRSKFDEIVDFSGLTEFIDTPVKRYSSGMYARLGFSVAAHVDPDVLVVDEVLSVGDFAFQRRCVQKMNAILHNGATLIFVSHDLKTVADLCHRALLLEKGRVLMLGETHAVISRYLTSNMTNGSGTREKDVYISQVEIRGEKGSTTLFESGETLSIYTRVVSRARHQKLSVVIYIKDSNYYEIFNTSTERLENRTFSPGEGETWDCTFRIALHLTEGSYTLGVIVYQYNIQKLHDEKFPAGMIYVHSEKDVRGGAHLYPELLQLEPVAAAGPSALPPLIPEGRQSGDNRARGKA